MGCCSGNIPWTKFTTTKIPNWYMYGFIERKERRKMYKRNFLCSLFVHLFYSCKIVTLIACTSSSFNKWEALTSINEKIWTRKYPAFRSETSGRVLFILYDGANLVNKFKHDYDMMWLWLRLKICNAVDKPLKKCKNILIK